MNATSSFPDDRPSPLGVSSGTKRKILRWVHLIFTIPILGYIYGRPGEVQQYAAAVRYLFVPALMLSGFWMYAGALLAIAAVAVWLGAYALWGSGAAILCEAGFLILWKAGRVMAARRAK